MSLESLCPTSGLEGKMSPVLIARLLEALFGASRRNSRYSSAESCPLRITAVGTLPLVAGTLLAFGPKAGFFANKEQLWMFSLNLNSPKLSSAGFLLKEPPPELCPPNFEAS
ncbi:hypothetical protein RUND412_001376 [Rhizina undulata]